MIPIIKKAKFFLWVSAKMAHSFQSIIFYRMGTSNANGSPFEERALMGLIEGLNKLGYDERRNPFR